MLQRKQSLIGLENLLIALCLIISFSGCENTVYVAVNPNYNPNPGDPVETAEGNGAGFESAFEGQTRGPSATTTTPIQIELITKSTDLYRPWAIEFINEREFLVTQKNGIMRVVDTNGDMGDPIEGVPKVFSYDNSTGHAGLFDIAIDPDDSKIIYFSYSKGDIKANHVIVAKAEIDLENNRLKGVREIYTTSPAVNGTSTFGGRLLFHEGYLFLTTGA